MPAKKNIFIFGDSITYGKWDSLGGWANRLRTHFDSLALPLPEDFIITYNLGIPSDTSAGVAQRLTQETQSRLTPNPSEKAIQIIIAIGTNDSRCFLDGKKYEIEHDQFRKNIEDITKAATAFTNDIVFVGLLPCIEADVLETGRRHDWDVSYDNQSIRSYNEIIKQNCIKTDHEFIDLFTVFESMMENTDHEPLFGDGLHPNDKGHAVIYDVMVKNLT